MAADTRATNESIVADKNCAKIHRITPLMWCCGAGTAADTEFTTQLVSSKLALHTLNQPCPGHRQRHARVVTAMTMLKQYLFRYKNTSNKMSLIYVYIRLFFGRHQGHIGAALILGGVDALGAHLYTIYPHGSVDCLPFVSMGSGSLAAISVLESAWRPGLNRDESIALAKAAITAGILNDLGSGSNVDVMVLDKVALTATMMRNCEVPTPRPARNLSYTYPKGTTPVLQRKHIVHARTVISNPRPTPMEE